MVKVEKGPSENPDVIAIHPFSCGMERSRVLSKKELSRLTANSKMTWALIRRVAALPSPTAVGDPIL